MVTNGSTKTRIRDFYDSLSPHFRDLWGEHLHDGYYADGDESKELAQEKLVAYLADLAQLPRDRRGLDIGCGMGATSVWLAKNLNAHMQGITLSEVQVGIAQALAEREGVAAQTHFQVADADVFLPEEAVDFVWMVGVLGHLPDQRGFVQRAHKLLNPGGSFVLADWVCAPELSAADRKRHVDPVLEGMLMPDIASLEDYRAWFAGSGFSVREVRDLTQPTRRTWDEGVTITKAPAMIKLALELGRDALGLVSAIKGMGRAMDRGLIRYGVLIAEKQ